MIKAAKPAIKINLIVMQEEINKTTLDRALQQLPSHEAPAWLWADIVSKLEEGESADHLKATIRELPRYVPPAKVWTGIEAELNNNQDSGINKPSSFLRILIGRYAAAAAIGLLVLAYIGNRLLDQNPDIKVIIVESEEIVPSFPEIADWNEDNALFVEVMEKFASHPLIKERSEFKTLQEELKELDDAKSEIEYMIDNYGTDPDLVRQIGEIERERSEVLKEMVAMN